MRRKLQWFGLVGIILAAAFTAAGQTTQRAVASATDSYISQAYAFYQEYDYKNAIPLYRKALELQKKQPTLDKARWRDLVDSLGQSYGISGDLKNAHATFAYGLKKDPRYWAFHFNMACTYAEMNDVDNTIFHLRQVYEKREKTIKYPDPWTNPSFRGLIGNDKFVNALRELDTSR